MHFVRLQYLSRQPHGRVFVICAKGCGAIASFPSGSLPSKCKQGCTEAEVTRVSKRSGQERFACICGPGSLAPLRAGHLHSHTYSRQLHAAAPVRPRSRLGGLLCHRTLDTPAPVYGKRQVKTCCGPTIGCLAVGRAPFPLSAATLSTGSEARSYFMLCCELHTSNSNRPGHHAVWASRGPPEL